MRRGLRVPRRGAVEASGGCPLPAATVQPRSSLSVPAATHAWSNFQLTREDICSKGEMAKTALTANQTPASLNMTEQVACIYARIQILSFGTCPWGSGGAALFPVARCALHEDLRGAPKVLLGRFKGGQLEAVHCRTYQVFRCRGQDCS